MDEQLLLPPLSPIPPVPPNPFLSLAPELKQAIFSSLPTVRTLASVTLTCSLFHRTFLDAAPLIIESILHTQIGSDLMFDAIILSKSTTLEPYSNDAAMELIELYAKQDLTCRSQVWKLRDALAMDTLHNSIDFFSRGIVSSTLSTNPVTGFDEVSPSPLSLLESNRIKRTFYRYELFCNIFRERERIWNVNADPETPQSKFFSMCAPWENEQLACVRDYLYDSLSLGMYSYELWPWYNRLTGSAFNDVAEHDVEWGELEMRYLNDWGARYDYWKECYLSLGLTYLHQIVNALTYEDRCRVLKARMENCYCSLYDALKAQGYSNGLEELETYTNEDERIHIPAQLAIDVDRGPEEAWRWAYADNRNEYWYNIEDRDFLRERGYVMWDFARLARWGLMDHEWDGLPHESVSYEEERRRQDDMRDSFKARHKIWCRGGRGWWSPGDESRIKWPPPAPPARPKTMAPKRCWGKAVWATDMQTWRENL